MKMSFEIRVLGFSFFFPLWKCHWLCHCDRHFTWIINNNKVLPPDLLLFRRDGADRILNEKMSSPILPQWISNIFFLFYWCRWRWCSLWIVTEHEVWKFSFPRRRSIINSNNNTEDDTRNWLKKRHKFVNFLWNLFRFEGSCVISLIVASQMCEPIYHLAKCCRRYLSSGYQPKKH